MLLNNQQITEEIKKEIKICIETNENENTIPLQGKENYDKSRQKINKQRLHFADKGLYSKSYGFPVFMYRCES